jgi:hypothetical protein
MSVPHRHYISVVYPHFYPFYISSFLSVLYQAEQQSLQDQIDELSQQPPQATGGGSTKKAVKTLLSDAYQVLGSEFDWTAKVLEYPYGISLRTEYFVLEYPYWLYFFY